MKKKIWVIIITLLVILGLSCFLSIFACEFLVRVDNYTVYINKLPNEFDGYKIALLSDFHNKMFRQGNEDFVKKILEQNPDCIVMTGDMINRDDEDFTIFLNLVEKLSEKPIYYIFGNHEMSLSKEKQNYLIQELEKRKVYTINNKKSEIILGDSTINLYGLNYNLKYYNKQEAKFTISQINQYLGEANEQEVNLLLAHNPLDFTTYAQWGADLTFSGHLHGGVVRIPFIKGLLSPTIEFFPKYDKGLYKLEDKFMVVSAGIGYGALPIRVFNLPELVIVTLEK